MAAPARPAPDVSVLMPVRDGGPYLAPALESVLGQTGVAFEVICVDDGSADDTWHVLRGYAERHPNLRVHRAEGRGISDALNQALDLSRGRFVARMDADDLCRPGRLALQARRLDAHPELGVLGGQALVIDAEGRDRGRLRVPVGAERVRAALQTSSPLIHPTVMMRRGPVLAAGGYRRLLDGAEDYDLWLRLAPSVRIDNLTQPVLLYRRHRDQKTARQPFRQARLAALAVVAHRLRRERGRDPLAEPARLADWRAAFAALDPAAVDEVRRLTASRLADNGGTLSPRGAAYFRLACRSLPDGGAHEVRRRLALACVRHELQTFRSGRWMEAAHAVARDALRWRGGLLRAYVWHASILWHAARVPPDNTGPPARPAGASPPRAGSGADRDAPAPIVHAPIVRDGGFD